MSSHSPSLLVREHRSSSTSLVPKLSWPGFDVAYSNTDHARFPTWGEENYRHQAGEFGGWSPEFIKAFRRARDRIWLVDGFLLKVDEHAASNFFSVFEHALGDTTCREIRLITCPKNGHHEQIKNLNLLQDIRQAPPRREPFTIDVLLVRGGKSSVRLPHDRFAIIDDELWHWGANVGGTHHEVNAYSRGWSANEAGAVDYFERLWNNLREDKS